MVKAVDSSGSRGIHRADRMEELEYAWQEAKKVTKKPYVLVEEFIEADEIGRCFYWRRKNRSIFST